MSGSHTKILAAASFAATLLCACAATQDQRIRAHAAEFRSYPPEVQADIRAGRIRPGFIPDMVLMALGKPDRKYTQSNEQGISEVWAYTAEAPKPAAGFSLGMGGGGGPVGYGVGVSAGGASEEVVEKTRVIFQNGAVTDVQELKAP